MKSRQLHGTVAVVAVAQTSGRHRSRKSDESIAESEATQSVLGASPDDVARWVLDAVDAGRFWVLSDGDDPFVRQLRNELDELMSAAGGVR
jgi:hypothetical protein